MARTNNTFFFKLVVVLSLVFMVFMSESKTLVGFGNEDSTLVCNSVHGTESGETCSAVAEEFNMTLEDFLTINPNNDCDAVFVGQWFCVDASASN